ncbi:hypothetical protein N7471_013767 [Penicillium samsonianum]|uniref:uncharacterized protein n=1 Tax=Penicillium samsonianum TaxID=1882272 RepID=UPI002547D4F7|nr:uncharacterized protein N7471_013767 [Penicillium samsonianum]KAJ6118300.1 hypothetical protein N7471_013767 [Penicillium samsonianum]
MKIESLLNPSVDKGNYTGSSQSQHKLMLSSLPSQSCKNTLGYTIAPMKIWCGQYLRAQHTSQRTISAVPANLHTSGASRNSLQLHYHNHSQFILYRPPDLASFSQKLSQRHRFHYSTSRTDSADLRRSPRPKYEEEEMDFIWYHRVDLCQQWKKVHESFNYQFPTRQRLGFQGLQSKFYRFIKQKKCPTPRELRRTRDCATFDSRSYSPQFGVAEWAAPG